ncbi:MAG: dihydroorotate dehydrogenase, partial [Clostridiales bacterium]|nr:dihydroorotate dehydrogenase [Clostridiales bacterium]
MINMRVNVGIELDNPIIAASGTFSLDMGPYFDFNELGAVCLKGVFPGPREGNPPPRIAETASGMLNSIGLPGAGVDGLIADILPKMRKYNTKIIANVCGNTIGEYVEVAEKLSDKVDMLEVNVSCPNVKTGGMSFGTDAKKLEEVTEAVKKVAKCPIIVKLSPNVTSISDMAKAAESGGADVISLINTILGMKIDVNTRR